MRYEDVKGVRLPKVGFGTWTIGGRETPDKGQDVNSLGALRSALALGYTHFDTAESYAAGHCEELLGRAIRELRIDRSSLFITSKVKPENLTTERVVTACEGSLAKLATDYIDLYLIHWPNPSIRLEDTFKGLNQLLVCGKIRHVGVSNFDVGLLKEARELAGSPVLTNQVPMSIFERSYIKNGAVEYCQSNGIIITAYSPLKHGRLRTDPGVARIAASRGLTPFQVGIAWLCSQAGIITIPMSMNSQHQQENLDAADTVLTADEMQGLSQRLPPTYQ